jgi:hypothetical protein
MNPFYLSVASTLAVILVAGAASADDKSDAVRAGALFEEGRRLMAAEDYAAACPKLAESQGLDPAPDTAFDLGICYQKASEAAFKAARELARPPEQTMGGVSTYARALAPEVEGAPPGQTQRVVALTIGGGGVAGIVVGVITGLMAREAYDQARASCVVGSNLCAPSGVSQIHSAQDLAAASTISFLTGAAAVGAGAIVFFTAPKSKPLAGARVAVAPATQGAGLSVLGRF